MLSGPSFTPPIIDTALILLHGYGANGDDLASLYHQLAPQIPNLAVFAPNAPTQIMQNGFEWFSLDDYFANDKINADFITTLTLRAQKATNLVQEYIHHISHTYNINANQIILAGFSQGGLIAANAALTYNEKLKGAIIMSGVPIDTNAITPTQNPPILLTHGKIDTVVPIQALDINEKNLQAAHCPTTMYISPNLEHGIDNNCITHIIDFINAR